MLLYYYTTTIIIIMVDKPQCHAQNKAFFNQVLLLACNWQNCLEPAEEDKNVRVSPALSSLGIYWIGALCNVAQLNYMRR